MGASNRLPIVCDRHVLYDTNVEGPSSAGCNTVHVACLCRLASVWKLITTLFGVGAVRRFNT